MSIAALDLELRARAAIKPRSLTQLADAAYASGNTSRDQEKGGSMPDSTPTPGVRTLPAKPVQVAPEFILEPLPIKNLRVDTRYQRDLKESRVAAITSDYKPERFQPITVGMRMQGDLWVVDGQHRVEAARRMGWASVPCMVFESDGFEHEAAVFEALQTARAPLSVPQRWKARLARQEPTATAINALLSSLGLYLADAKTTRKGAILAHTAVEKAYLRGNLRDVLVLIQQAWGDNRDGLRAEYISWLSLTLVAMQQHGDVDMARLSTALGKFNATLFLNEMPAMGNASAVFMRRLLDKYNASTRTHKVIIDDPAEALKRATARVVADKVAAQGRPGFTKAQQVYAAMSAVQRSALAKRAWETRRALSGASATEPR